MEWFDVVDERDRVIDRQPRHVVHARGLRHRAASVIVINPAGQLLIQRRSMHKDEFPGRWSPSASGHLSSGDTYAQAAHRELLEEVGLSCPLTWQHTFAACAQTANEFMALYTGQVDPKTQPPTPDGDEVTEVRWIAPQPLVDWMQALPDDFTPSFRLVFSWWVAHRAG